MWVWSALAWASPEGGEDLVDRATFVAAVLDANRMLAGWQHEAEATNARAEGAGRWEEPRLEGSVAPFSLPEGDAPAGYEISLSQALPLSGAPSADRDLARAEGAVTVAMADTERLALAVEASATFAEWRFVHDARILLEEQDRVLVDVEQAVRAAYTATDVGLGAVLGVESERIDVEHRRLELDASRIALNARMNALLHRDVLAPIAPPEPAPTNLEPPDEPNETPDVARASLVAEAASLALRATRRSNVPDPMVMASYATMWDHVDHRFMVGVGIDLPVQPGRRRASVDEGEALVAAASARTDAARDGASSRFTAARAAFDAAMKRRGLHEERGIPVAEQRLRAERAAFEAGTGELASLLDAADGLLVARWEALEARSDAERAWAELQGSAGRLDSLVGVP